MHRGVTSLFFYSIGHQNVADQLARWRSEKMVPMDAPDPHIHMLSGDPKICGETYLLIGAIAKDCDGF